MNTIDGLGYPDKLEIQRAKKVIERGIDFQDKLDKANEKKKEEQVERAKEESAMRNVDVAGYNAVNVINPYRVKAMYGDYIIDNEDDDEDNVISTEKVNPVNTGN